MNRLERLYAISDVLRRESPWPVSAARLADRFDVSRRATRSTAEEAVRTGTVMAITYRDRNGTVTKRLVEPVGFFGNAEHWSLVAWCRLRNAGRLFHLQRIVRAKLTRERAADRDYDEVLGWVPDRGAGLVDAVE